MPVSTRDRGSSPTGRNAAERTRAPRTEPQRRGTAGRRAYARRAERAGAPATGGSGGNGWIRWPRSRVSFILVLMALMIAGVVATLWWSTQAIADSYRLQRLREENRQLTERAEQLHREVGQLASSSSLARRARELGMVPGGSAARLVVEKDGTITVIGEPRAATAPPEAASDPADGEETPDGAGGTDADTDSDAEADTDSGTDSGSGPEGNDEGGGAENT